MVGDFDRSTHWLRQRDVTSTRLRQSHVRPKPAATRRRCVRCFHSRALSSVIPRMPWIVKVRNEDGTVAAVLTLDWAAACSAVEAHRSSSREAWIEDAEGRRADESQGDG